MKLTDFDWMSFSEGVHKVLLYFIQKVRDVAPEEHLYVLAADADTYDALINPIANSSEVLAELALEKFPDRPSEVAARVLKWETDHWEFQYYCDHADHFEYDTLSEYCRTLSELSLDDDERALRNLEFRRAVVRALVSLTKTPEFANLPKTDDFVLRYYEDESLIFKSLEQMEAFLNS